jgi:hypothetical protein
MRTVSVLARREKSRGPEERDMIGDTIEAASWWQPSPSILAGIASLGGIFGQIPFDRSRFAPGADAVLLRRDGTILMLQFKLARNRVAEEAQRDRESAQPRLFDPDAE